MDEVLSARAYMCFVSHIYSFTLRTQLMSSMKGLENSCTICLEFEESLTMHCKIVRYVAGGAMSCYAMLLKDILHGSR